MRKFLLILGVCFIIAGFLLLAGAPVAFILPEVYESKARILTSGDSTATPDLRQIQTEIEVIQSKSVIFQVISNLQLGKAWAKRFNLDELKPEECYLILKNRLRVKGSKNTYLIDIAFSSQDKLEAAMIANEIARVYGETTLRRRQPAFDSAATNAGAIKDTGIQIIDAAEPALRPKRNAIRMVAIGVGFLIFGVLLVWRSGRKQKILPPRR